MVAINQPKQARFCQPHSDKRRSNRGLHRHFQERSYSGSNLLIVPQQSTEQFVADDLLAVSERLILIGPLPSEWPIIQGLVRTNFVVEFLIGRDNGVKVFLAEDQENVEGLKFHGFYPPLNVGILIWHLRYRLLHSTSDVLKHLVEFLDVHAIAIANEILHSEVCFAGLFNERMSLANYPSGVRFETTGRAEDFSRADMDKYQHKRLAQPTRRPGHLAEEIGLPQRIDMQPEKLIPRAAATFRARLNPLFLEDVLHRRVGTRVNADLFQFSKDTTVAPAC